MRAAPVIIASALAHAVAFAVLAQITVRGRRVVPPVAPPPRVADDPTPIDIVFLDAPTSMNPDAASAVRTGSTARAPTTRASSARASTGSRATSAHEGTAGELTGTGASSATANGNAGTATGIGLELAPDAAERIANGSGSAQLPAEPKVSGKLKPTPGGGAVSEDVVTTMTVEPDGNVRFADKPDIDIKVKLPIPRVDIEGMRQDLGKLLTDWYRDPYAGTRFGAKQDVARHLTAVPGTCDSWGDVMCDDPLAPKSEQYAREQKKTRGSLLGGTMDITAWLHRKFVGDPYASRKLKLLDDTRDERVAMGGAYRNERLEQSAEIMRRNLEALWAAPLSSAERREALFELWDECDEGLDTARGEAGERARAMVIGWIRSRIPKGSAEGFSDDEVARLHARRTSNQAFTPY